MRFGRSARSCNHFGGHGVFLVRLRYVLCYQESFLVLRDDISIAWACVVLFLRILSFPSAPQFWKRCKCRVWQRSLIHMTDGANVEITSTSGTVRVTVRPAMGLFVILIDAAILYELARSIPHAWPGMSLFNRAIVIAAVVSVVFASLYQLVGSEIIEFDQRKLTIRTELFGLGRTREYDIEKCSSLEGRQQTRGNHDGLKCKVGWRTITFGRYVTDEQTDQILAALQNSLPEVARKLLILDSSEFTTLHLN